MKNNTTLKKISQILDISISTVSRALKNHPDISERTRQKVLELANTLDYEPNTYAINLRTNKSKVFGLIVPSVSFFFYDSFIAAVEEECKQHGYSLMILQSGDDPDTEQMNIRLCRQNRVSGVFLCITPYTKDMHSFRKLNEMDIPLIFFDKVPLNEPCNKICVADASAARIAADAIIIKRRKKVLALFGNNNLSITQKRKESFTEAFKQKNPKINLTCDEALSTNEAREKTLHHFTQKNKPDTIFCMSDEILIGSMRALQELKLKPPDDVAVIAISNGFMPSLYFPEITYVETSGYKLGKLAFTSMMACLSGSTFQQELTVESILVEGGSL